MAGLWFNLNADYRASRRRARTISAKSALNLQYVLADLSGWLDGAPSAGPARRGGPKPRPVGPWAPADEIIRAVEDWVESHPAWSANTICTQLGLIRPFLEWAAAHGHMTGGVARQLKNPRKPRPLPRALPARAIDNLLAVVPDARGRVIVLLEAQCGLRRAEVAAVSWPADVDLPGGTVLVHGKGEVERMVYLSDETRDALRVWLNERGAWPGPLICRYEEARGYPRTKHMTPTMIGKLVTTWLKQAGLKSLPYDGVAGHALRHTAATQLLRGGANIRVVQNALGHASITTTARYLRVEDAEVRAAMSSLTYGRRLRAVNENP